MGCPSDGWTPPRVDPAGARRAPPQIDGLTAFTPLGAGGFAEVWQAVREATGEVVAVKVGVADSPVLRARFAREFDALQRIGPPHTPAALGHGELGDGRPYIVMERLEGETLSDRLGAIPGPPDLAWVAKIAGGLLAALAAAHARGILHRDLKPENVFLAGDRVALLDFGLTRGTEREGDLTRTGVAVGTPEYMAPEQIRGEATIDARADVYAFGVLLFELFTLRPPFVGDVGSIEHGHQILRPPRPSEIALVPRPIEDLVLACLAKERDRRPADAMVLARAFAEACGQASADALPLSGSTSQSGSLSQRAPVSGRSGRPRLLAAGQQPVAVLVTDTPAASSRVVSAMTDRGGIVVRQRASRYVAVFSADHADDPLKAALAAARELEQRERGRAAIHIAAVTIRAKKQGAPMVYGAAVDRPEAWLPAEPWSGVRLWPDAARLVEDSAERGTQPIPPSGESVGSAITGQGEAPLTGRDDVIAAIEASAAASFDRGSPGLFTLIGDHGLGKTRLAAAAPARVIARSPGALVISVRAAPFEREAGFPLAEEILAALRGAPIDPPADHRDRVAVVVEAILERCRKGPIAVIVDDAHRADDAVLDALEVATFEDKGCPLWVMVVAHPRFEEVRRSWGQRTRHRARHALAPLDTPAAKQLAAALLQPAEYPPDAVLARLAAWSGGSPGSLTELSRALKRAGIIRRRGETRSYYVATAVLDGLPPSPAGQWVAARQLGALLPEIAACLRLCAVLGVTFSQAELEGVEAALEDAGSPMTSADAGVAIRALAEAGMIQRGAGDRWSFQNALFQDAVYAMLDASQRDAAHRAAFAYWRARAIAEPRAPEVLEPLARHASAAGEREEAAGATLTLGAIAFAQHRHVDADQHFTAALDALDPGEVRRRAIALAGRGRSRYRMGRARDACDDLLAGRALARDLGDRALEAELLLEEATAFDSWLREFDRAAERVEEAREILAAIRDPALEVRLLLAQGRVSFRGERFGESIALLERALAGAAAIGDHETRIGALLLLAFQRVAMGRLDEAEASFEQVIALTTEAKDWPHLSVAYTNRVVIWHARGQPDRALADLRRAMDLARAFGDPLRERNAAVNATLMHHLSGEIEPAVELARRVCMLEERFVERPTALGPMLLARSSLLLGQIDEARRIAQDLERSPPPDLSGPSEAALSLKMFFRMLRLVMAELDRGAIAASEVQAGWQDLFSIGEEGLRSGAVGPEDLLEIAYWRASMALRGGRRADAEEAIARSYAWRGSNAAWRSRLEEIERRLAEGGDGAVR